MQIKMFAIAGCAALALAGLSTAAPAAAQYRQTIPANSGKCAAGDGPGVWVTLDGVKQSRGTIRVQAYRATQADWMVKGRWLNRIEMPAKAGTMRVCMPLPGPGAYGIAVRHDLDGDGKTDIFGDGGAISNNPSVNIFNLGKPSYRKAAFEVGNRIESITLQMRYR